MSNPDNNNKDQNDQNQQKEQTLSEYLDKLSDDIFEKHEETVVYVIYSVLAFIIQLLVVWIMQKSIGMAIRKAYLAVLQKYSGEISAYGMKCMLEDESKVTQDPIRFMNIFPFMVVSFFIGIFWIFAVYKKNKMAKCLLGFLTVFFGFYYLAVMFSWMVQKEHLNKLLINAIINNEHALMLHNSWLHRFLMGARDVVA
jgi:hypothetical protein